MPETTNRWRAWLGVAWVATLGLISGYFGTEAGLLAFVASVLSYGAGALDHRSGEWRSLLSWRE